jgi:DNA replication protein DnaC
MDTLGFSTRAAALFRDPALGIDVVIDDLSHGAAVGGRAPGLLGDLRGPYQVRSLILTSQLPVTRWHEQIGDPTVADSILDRLVHNAHRIEMRGDSMRNNRGKPNA